MTSVGRQTVLREYTVGFPFKRSKKRNGSVNHVVHEADQSGNAGQTYCARWQMVCSDIETELEVLNVARNLCSQCATRLDDDHLEILAVMASASSQHHIEVTDITE